MSQRITAYSAPTFRPSGSQSVIRIVSNPRPSFRLAQPCRFNETGGGPDLTAGTVQALSKALEQRGGRRQSLASAVPAAKFLIEGFLCDSLSGTYLWNSMPGGSGKPREGPDAPGRRWRAIGPGRKSRRGGSGAAIGAWSGGRVQVIAGALQGEVRPGGRRPGQRRRWAGSYSGETPSPA